MTAMAHELPSSLGQIPAWMILRSRLCGTMRHYIKFAILIIACLMLGYTISRLHVDMSRLPHALAVSDLHSTDAADSRYRIATDHEASSFTEGRVDHSLDIAQHEQAQAGKKQSIYSQVTSTLNEWSSWTKSGLDKLTGASDTNTAFLTPGLEDEPTSTGEQVWGDISPLHGDRPRVGKVSIVFGENRIYERALRTHTAHNRLHNYQMFTLRQAILDDVWTKPAYILSIILRELARPEADRLQWLLWVDADTIILNPHIPSELFLPPPGREWEHIHLLATYDWNGLNNGVFPIRVHAWSVELLSAIVAFRQYRAGADLTFRDQSAMAQLLEEPRFKAHVLRAPQRWFNAYQGELNETLAPFQFRRGDFLVHFAGDPNRDEHMITWLERAESHDAAWEVALKHTTYPQEVREFWQQASTHRAQRASLLQKARVRIASLVEKVESALLDHGAQLDANVAAHIRDRLVETKNAASATGDEEAEPQALDDAATQFEKDAAPALERAAGALHSLQQEAHQTLFDGEHLLFGMETEGETTDETERLEAHVAQLKHELQREPVQWTQLRAATAQLAATVRQTEQALDRAAAEADEAGLEGEAEGPRRPPESSNGSSSDGDGGNRQGEPAAETTTVAEQGGGGEAKAAGQE